MISVIIPAYNEGRYIAKTLNSIKKQDFNHELIVVCNGCTDNTDKIAKKYTNRVFNLKEKNVSKARNYGAKKSKGEILVFLDADTCLSNNCLEIINESLNSSVVIGTCKGIPDSKKLIYRILLGIKNSLYLTPWVNGILFCKKDVFKKINGFNENIKIREYRDLIKRALIYGKFTMSNAEVINSMRRFEKLGVAKISLFWLKSLVNKKEEYKAVR